MAFHLSFLAILSGLSGIHSITTVSKLSVKKGNSISIPCLYDSTYINHVKYLCKGYSWSSCSYAVKTNQPSLGSFSISDDKKHRIFTVTINDVMDKDADYYWCAVEINGGPDVKEYFHLSVAKGTPGLYVDNQEISAFKGDPISINCNYSTPGEKKWCRLGRSCVTGSSGSIDGTGVTISEMTAHAVFTVTMSKVRMENSGWYLCFKGDFQMPVHLTVTEPPTTISADKAPSTVPNAQRSGVSANLKSLIIPLSLLIFVVIVTLFIWFMLKRHMQTKAESSATTMRSGAESDVDVVYSSVVIVEKQSGKRVETEDVLYSCLAPHQQSS
ncbi:polymeric immunoglobulin receptor-like isoform X2 [Pempheris klunzingeri]|uniref:polymeric immunoglobulin receptor-like isoform X2 n=1 Tax=Pempheris klunzingeri TaxID=3127111 RepID=UPI00397FFB6B